MKKLKFTGLFLIIAVAISCSQIKNAVNTFNEEPPANLNLPQTDVVRGVENASPDAHLGEEKAIVVSALEGGRFFVGKTPYQAEELLGAVELLLKKDPSERQLIYVNSAARTEYGDVVRVLDILRKADVENVGLRVDPKEKGEARFYILKVKLPDEPKEEDFLVKPNPLTLIITLAKDDKMITINREPMKVELLKIKLKEIFADRASNGVTREGTNDIEKTIYIKAPRSASYRDVVLLIDAATGAGAPPVWLQIDDLEK